MLHRLVAPLELDLERLREVLSEVVRRAGLERTAIPHERFDRIRARRSREFLALALLPVHDRHRELRLDELLVDPEDAHRLLLRLGLGLVRRVPLLPEELRRAQE